MVEYCCHGVLHQELTQHISQIDRMTLFHDHVETIQKAVRLELVSVIKWRFNASTLTHLVLPEPQLLQNHLLISNNSVLQAAKIKVLHHIFKIDAEFDEVARVSLSLDLG